MKHSEFPSQRCSVARALEIVGDWWTLLIVREAFFGTERFSEFEAMLGIAKNMLSERLAKLVEAGVMTRVALAGRGNPHAYQLTERGRDLFPVVIALMQWGDRWVHGPDAAPVRVLDRASGDEISLMQVSTPKGKRVMIDDIEIVPGPGANAAVRRRFQHRREA